MDGASDEVAALRKESKVITKELLESALRYKEKNDKLKVKTFTVTPGCKAGDNYATVAFALKVTTIDENDVTKVHDWFVKTVHNNERIREWTLNESKIFVKETNTYTDIIPDMIRYQKDRGIESIGPSVPNFVYGIAEINDPVLILEDLRPLGYSQADRIAGLDFEHCELVMTKLAAFHALGYALKNESHENLKRYNFMYHDSLFSKEVPLGMAKCFEFSARLMKTITDNSRTSQSLDKLLNLDLLATVRGHIKPSEPYAVICHGDMWLNNMLFKYDDECDRRKPIDVKLLDLQIVRYALPSTDLAYFFFLSTTVDTRKKHLRKLLQIYHKALSEFLQKLSEKFTVFSFDELEKMFAESVRFGLIHSLFAAPTFLTVPQSNTGELTFKTEAESAAFVDDFYAKLSEIEGNMTIITDRLLGAVEEAIELGVI